MPYVAVISKAGYDWNDPNPRNLIFSSEFDALPIVLQGSSSQVSTGFATKTFTISHGQSFIPFPLVYYKTSYASTKWRILPGGNGLVTGDFNSGIVEINSTNLVVTIFVNNTDPETIYIRYILFGRDV